MSRGRSFPIRNPFRSVPFDPMDPSSTARTFPIPFAVGAGSSSTIATTVTVRLLVQSTLSAAGTGTGGTTATTCNPLTNQYCVPSAALAHINAPTATLRCTIT